MSIACRIVVLIWALLTPCLCGCDIWAPPLPTEDELDQGLVVFYPGSFNTSTEMLGFYSAFREAGIDQAIEVVKWSAPLEHFLDPPGFAPQLRLWATDEARRIAAYQNQHPGNRVSLLGFSAGALTAIMVAEQMPEEHYIDCVILMSPGVSHSYDLTPMLSKTREGAVVYWSPREEFAIALTSILGTADGVFTEPAAALGFRTHSDNLTELVWDPSMAAHGNDGDHLSYFLNVSWIRDFIAPLVSHPDRRP